MINRRVGNLNRKGSKENQTQSKGMDRTGEVLKRPTRKPAEGPEQRVGSEET